ncbi:MAG: RING finger domain-containing protein [Candidatus Thorarchaeota archaeon]
MVKFKHINLISNDIAGNGDNKTSLDLKVINTTIKSKFIPTKIKRLIFSESNLGDYNPSSIDRCGICWSGLEDNDEISSCPNCSRKFHKVHWIDWLSKKPFCPICRKSV